jgi:hypothetical protein
MRRVLLLNPDHAHAESVLGTSTTTSSMAPAPSTKRPFAPSLSFSGCPLTGGHARECWSVSRGDRLMESSERQAAS